MQPRREWWPWPLRAQKVRFSSPDRLPLQRQLGRPENARRNQPRGRTTIFPQLLQDVYDHTFQVLKALSDHGITPEWVQIGNEITYPECSGRMETRKTGRSWSRLINRGEEAVKAINPGIKVIIHLDRGKRAGNGANTWFDNFTRLGGKCDVIGMSYYPWWQKKDYLPGDHRQPKCANLNNLAARFGKEVMVAEVGGKDTRGRSHVRHAAWPCRRRSGKCPAGKGWGSFYWEPEGAASWSHYGLSCWGADGRPTAALRAFLPGAGGVTPQRLFCRLDLLKRVSFEAALLL